MDSAFLVSLLTSCSLFRLQMPFECIDFFEMVGQRYMSASSFGFNASLFLLFKFDDCSAISRVVLVLVTIVTPYVWTLMILRRLAYNADNRFRYPYYLLVVRKDSDNWCTWSSPSSLNGWNKILIPHKKFQKRQCLHLPLLYSIQESCLSKISMISSWSNCLVFFSGECNRLRLR
jgi:hypothetical protein